MGKRLWDLAKSRFEIATILLGHRYIVVFDSFVLPQNNIELAVELAFLVPTAVSPTCTTFTIVSPAN